MAKLPVHPDLEHLKSIRPSVTIVPANTTVYRIYKRGGEHPTLWNAHRFFGPTGSRFDHQLRDTKGKPTIQERGICYLSTDIPTGLAEVYQRDRTVDRERDEPWLVAFKLACDLTLLNLTGTFAVRAGGSMKIVSGTTSHSQNWSRGFYEAYTACDGILYPSSMTNRTCFALYERCLEKSPIPKHPSFHRALNDPLLIRGMRNAARDIGYAVV